MRRYILVALALVSWCAFAIGGYAVGAYMQFLQTFSAAQDTFARDLITARGLKNNQGSELLEAVKLDIPLQYQFLVDFESIRNSSLPVRLSVVTRMTWSQWSMASAGIRSSDRWQHMMRSCECDLVSPESKP